MNKKSKYKDIILMFVVFLISVGGLMFMKNRGVSNNWFYFIPVFFTVLGLIFNQVFVVKETRVDKNSFNSLMLFNMLKLVLSILFVLIYLLFNKELRLSFVLTYFIFYVFFSAYEVKIFLIK